MMMMKRLSAATLLLMTVAAAVTADQDKVNHGNALIDWLRSEGGFVSDKLEIKTIGDEVNGIFTNADLEQDEIILKIPYECLITSDSKIKKESFQLGDRIEAIDLEDDVWYAGVIAKVHENNTYGIDYDDGDIDASLPLDRIRVEHKSAGAMDCTTARILIQEMSNPDESPYGPYVKYLLEQEHGQLPSGWSLPGQRLLEEMLSKIQVAVEGGEDDEEVEEALLPPNDVTNWKNDWPNTCGGTRDNPFELNAALMVVQRGWDDILIPVFDMMNHRNGKWLNTKSNQVQEVSEGGHVEVRVSRKVEAGEELHTTYNFCEDCGARLESYGTPEILRDYGFVEQFPQRWIFHREEVAFDLDETETGEFEVTWFKEEPDDEGIEFLQEQLLRLQQFAETDLVTKPQSVPEKEFQVLKKYNEALVTAMRLAIQDVNGEDDACATGNGECPVSFDRYDQFEWRDGDLQTMYSCDVDKNMEFHGYVDLETIDSHYQNMDWFKDPKNNDTCFQLEKIVQICSSYRPHYHESSVHYAARFLKEVKRVIFIGGGDSMLLHEVLKYPSLEKVVGLELDQKVVRSSFKYFGSQPHWDDDRVEWWFGDATKSLLMLPEDYSGSFDLILVDLSETVMSFPVTKELDIMEALSLLLKPEGVFLKNELYFEKLSNIFEYTVEFHYYDCPLIGSQSMVISSNKIDFLEWDLTDHNVDTLWLPSLEETDKYLYFHDYRRNHTSIQKHCADELEPIPEPEEQEKSPGILMIVEAENISESLSPPEKFKDTIDAALKKGGLNPQTSVLSEAKGGTVVTILKEGYVVARMWPEHKYCAFDIHLWSKFSLHENVKKALLDAVGSASPSSFRIVAGGMFSAPTWKEDEIARGPRITQVCDRPAAIDRDADSDMKNIEAALDESLTLAPNKIKLALVLCGLEKKKKDCKSLDVLKKNKNVVGDILPVWSCPDLEDNEYVEGAFKKMFECEKVILNQIKEAVAKNNGLVDAIVVDLDAPRALAQIVYRIFDNGFNRHELLAKDIFVVAPMVDQDDAWRREFLQRFKYEVIYDDPVSRAEIQFNSSDSSFELGVTTSGDKDFFIHLTGVIERIEKRTGLVSDLRNVVSGFWIFQHNFVPTQFFLPGDYDQSGPLEQYVAQQPLGHQSIFQLEDEGKSRDISCAQVKEDLKRSVNETFSVEDALVTEFSDGLEGCVVVVTMEEGGVIALWDGKIHIDINLFTYSESVDNANKFVNTFKARTPSLKVVLRDEQPRGFGRVVNFLSEIEPRAPPHWSF